MAIISIIAVGLGYWTETLLWGLFGGLLLLLSLEGFYLPTKYEFRASGFTAVKLFSRSARDWNAWRRVYEDRFGLTLSPYRGRRWLEPYRSVRLLFDGGDRDAIRAWVRASIDPGVEWIELKTRTGRTDGMDRPGKPVSGRDQTGDVG